MSIDSQLSPHPRYRLLALIGKGGMGEVFRAHDRLSGQIVALKRVSLPWQSTPAASPIQGRGTSLGGATTLGARAQVSPNVTEDTIGAETVSSSKLQALRHASKRPSPLPQFAATMAAPSSLDEIAVVPVGVVLAERSPSPELQALRLHLAQEFRTLAGLRHPHIVSVLDYGFDRSQQPYFTMELLEGSKTLDEAVRKQPTAVQGGLLLQVLQALTYLHRRGVLHRDLKPGNILVISRPRGPHVKILDFGLALSTLGLHSQRTEVAGTIGYIAPEVLAGEQPSEASDLFAVGVMAHEILVGSHPLGSVPTAEIIRGFLGPAPLFSEDARLSPALAAVLRRALSRVPTDRYLDAAEFGHDLARAMELPPPPETLDIRESFLQAAHFQSRNTEMEALLSALRQSMHGRGQVILIGGEAGVGKSRLLDEFRAQALVRGARVLRGQAVREGGGAFLVMRDVLAPLCLEHPLDDLQAGVLSPLVPRLPELLEHMVIAAPNLDAKSTQDRALAVIEQVLLSAATTPLHPLVILLEDLQWVGSEVVLLLERLSEMSKSHPLLVLGNYRDDECPELPVAIPHAEVLRLRRFDKATVAKMAVAMLGSTGPVDEVVERLYKETEGNAFFIVEVLRALAENAGQLAAVGSRNLPTRILAGGVRAILENRLGRVPTWARPLLERAAVTGRQLDLRALGNSYITETHSDATMEVWLAVCADLSILEISDQVWRFSHDKLRECLLEQIETRGELSQLHRAVPIAIEQSYEGAERDSHAAALALHFSMAGDVRQAAHYGLKAGEHSLHGGALNEAVELLHATLRYQAQDSTGLLEGVRTRRLLSAALFALGRMEESANATIDLFGYVGHPLPQHASGRARVALRSIAIHVARPVLPAVRLTPELSRELVRELELAVIQSGGAFIYGGKAADVPVLGLLQYVLTKQAGNSDSDLLYTGAVRLMVSLLPLGPLQRSGPTKLPSSGASFAEAYSMHLVIVFTINLAQGYWAEGERAAILGFEIARVRGDAQLQMHFEMGLMVAAQYRGEVEKARFHANALMAVASRSKNALFRNGSLRCLAAMDLIETQAALALKRLHTLTTESADIGDAMGVLEGMGLMARAYLMLGDREQSRHWAEQALATAQSRPFSGFGVLEGCIAPAEVLSVLAEEEKNPQARRVLITLAGQALVKTWHYAMTFPIGHPRANLVTGIYARMRGQNWLARLFFQRSLSAARELSMQHEAKRALAALASFSR